MLLQCRYCGCSINGQIALDDHKRSAHRVRYYQDRIVATQQQIESLNKSITRYKEIIAKES